MCWVDIVDVLMEDEIKESVCYFFNKTLLEENIEMQ